MATDTHGPASRGKALVRALYDAFATGDVAALDGVVAPGYVQHDPMVPPGRAGLEEYVAVLRRGFPDLRADIEDLIAEGDLVVARVVCRGTHAGPFLGIPATGRAVTLPTIDVFRAEAGRLVEHWDVVDRLGPLQALRRSRRGPEQPPAARPADAAPGAPPGPLADRFVDDVLRRGDLDAVDALLAAGFVDHLGTLPGIARDRGGARRAAGELRAAFPDLRVTVAHRVAEADRIALHLAMRGTHRGALLGIPPTGRPAAWREIHIARASGGTIVERWAAIDLFDLLGQLGALPAIRRAPPA